MIVYYTTPKNADLSIPAPEPAYADAVRMNGFDKSDDIALNFLKCPAIKDYYKNTFVIKSPFDYNVKLSKSEDLCSVYPYDQKFFDDNFLVRSTSNRILTLLAPQYAFFAEKDLMVEQVPASAHKDAPIGAQLFCGTFNVGKHLRPIEFAFTSKHDIDLNIKDGTPLYYVRFITDEEITFKQFNYTDEIDKLANWYCAKRDYTSKVIPLKWYYDTFVEKGFRKKLLDEIKKEVY